MTPLKGSDDTLTVLAVGLLAYLSADLAHHLAGHGGACVLEQGHIRFLSSIVLQCTHEGALIDLGGPIGNVVIGALALLAFSYSRAPTPRLFFLLAAAFNLLWFAGQLVYSVITRRDDWAWPLADLNITPLGQYLLIGAGLALYVYLVRVLGSLFAPFATPRRRVVAICWRAWLAAGALAAATGLLDRNGIAAVTLHALPQSMLNAVGLLFLANPATRRVGASPASPIARSTGWIALAAAATLGSVVLLGPGYGVGIGQPRSQTLGISVAAPARFATEAPPRRPTKLGRHGR